MGGLERAPHAPHPLVPPRLSRGAPRSWLARSLERAPHAPYPLVPPRLSRGASRSWLARSLERAPHAPYPLVPPRLSRGASRSWWPRPRRRAPGGPGMLGVEIPEKVRHLERRGGGLLSPVADRAAGAGPSLLLGICRDDAERGGNPRDLCHVPDSGGRLPGHVLEVRSLPADDHANAHDRGVAAGTRKVKRGQGQLERTRNPVQFHRLRGHLGLPESVTRPLHPPGPDGLVETGPAAGQTARRRRWRPEPPRA